MQSVVGLDVSKGKSDGQAMIARNKPFGNPFTFEHSKSGFAVFLLQLQKVEKESGSRPHVILEATGHYHLPVVGFLREHGYVVILLNPLTAQRAKRAHLRKVKTDAADAMHLAALYYQDEFEPYRQKSVQLSELQYLTRQHEAMTEMYVQMKLKFQATLDQVFPAYVGVFGDLYSKTSLKFLQENPTPTKVIQIGLEGVAEFIQSMNKRSKSSTWVVEKAKKIMTAASNSPSSAAVHDGHLFSLNMMIDFLLQYQEHLQRLEAKIDALARSISEYDLLRSIPGIGDKIAATILAEIGDIDQFDHAKKLVAFAGIDPSVFSSGKFVSTTNRITKRGSKRLRRALYMAVQCGLRRSTNKRLREFYDKKRIEGKAHKVAIIACANKLLHIVFALLSRNETYHDDRSIAA